MKVIIKMIEVTISNNKARISLFTMFCIGFGFFLIVFTFFQWDLIDYLTSFFLPLLLLLLWAVLAIITLGSMIYIPFQFKKIRWKSIFPLFVNSIIIFVLYFVPFNSLWLDFRFWTNKSDFEHIIKMYESGELQKPTESGRIELPLKYKHLSKGGGDIFVDNSNGITSMFFYTYRGIGNSSGFIYRSNDLPPTQYLLNRNCYQLERIEPKWFFCASD